MSGPLEYANAHLERLHPELAFAATTRSEWAAWQAEARARLWQLLGGRPATPAPLDARVEESVGEEGYRRELVTFTSRPGLRGRCYLLLPESRRRGSAVIFLHGHGATAEHVVGLAPPPEDASPNWRDHLASLRFPLRLARQGIAVAVPEIQGFGRLSDQPGAERDFAVTCARPMLNALIGGMCLQGLRVWDVMRVVDYLRTRPELASAEGAPLQVGCAGVSLGGELTGYATALDERLGAAVISGMLRPLKPELQRIHHCSCSYLPGLLAVLDFPDAVALIAPRPLLIESGRRDAIGLEAVGAAMGTLRRAYGLAGAEENLAHDVFDGWHVFHGAVALAWLPAALAANGRGTMPGSARE